MALCTQTQVEQRIQIDFTSDADPVCAELIAAATGHIVRVVGRPVEDDTYTETFDPPAGHHVWLTNTPVVSVTSVTVDATALASSGYSTDLDIGRLTRVSNGIPRSWSTSKAQSIVVVYVGGYETVPYDIQDVCARMAARAFQVGAAFASVPAGAEGVKQVALAGSDSVTYVNMDAALSSMILTDEEAEALATYRHVSV